MRDCWYVQKSTQEDDFDTVRHPYLELEQGCLVFKDGYEEVQQIYAPGSWLSVVRGED